MVATSASRKGAGRFFPEGIARVERPRRVGITHVLDRLHGLSREELRPLASYVDVVKIGWGLPLLLPREEVRKRVQFYHELGIEVSTGGTLLEYAVTRERTNQLMDEARELGFDLLEISDGIIELSAAQIEKFSKDARQRNLDVLIEVGKKNPQNQLSLRETLERVGRALALEPRKVILESRESGRGVGIYDGEGQIKWDWVRSIVADHPADRLIFEAPLETQQIALLRELGAETNLGNVSLNSVAPLASQRLGLRGDTFGSIRTPRNVKGPPATKFLYFLLETYRALDQSELVRLSRLPRRTVQSGLEELRRQGLVREGVSLVDSRRREYRLT
ncbi:MAG: phosphosulfolactate synthase [Thermoplasmata archaeon]|nr:phosphosulfolactate synthase [Thermoplasmata archaeon]